MCIRDSVDHGGVRVGADQRVRVRLQPVGPRPGEHHPREVLQVDLVADAGVRRHHQEVVEGLLGPAKQLVALQVALELQVGVDAERVRPGELVIDHSVIAEVFARPDAFRVNADLEFERNLERYQLLRWAQQAFDDFLVVPPDTGICHQVNLEYLSRVVFTRAGPDGLQAYPDTLVGTDPHTPMVNGLGVLGWGVGGTEAEAAMLGQPMSMLIPPVLGIKLTGEVREGTTATDLVLTIAELLRRTGVVGKFVEFYGPAVARIPLANRATLGNMSPEYGSTCAIFPVDDETLAYLRLTGRSEQQIRLVEVYAKEQGLWHDPDHEPAYSQSIEFDLASVEPSIAGPKRPQDRIPLALAARAIGCMLADGAPAPTQLTGLDEASAGSFPASDPISITQDRPGAVSYTHLRAHETVLDLVCRLLLEKKK